MVRACKYSLLCVPSNLSRQLVEYISKLDHDLNQSLSASSSVIDWFGESWSVERHLQAMISHEILHHGQLILYARVARFKLPKSWEAWGE